MTSITKDEQQQAVTDLRVSMESIAKDIRSLVSGMPAKSLIGYINSQRLLSKLSAEPKGAKVDTSNEMTDEVQFLLEYVHAVLASDDSHADSELKEGECAKLFELSRELRQQAVLYAMASSAATQNSEFGSATADIEFHAKTAWISLRGNRHQVLEREFYQYVLAPHNDVLQETYGVGSEDIAKGFQDMANAYRTGFNDAIAGIFSQFESAQHFAAERNKSLEESMKEWSDSHPEEASSAGTAFDNLFFGGTANISRHTDLPANLLADLSYRRGEDTEFYAEGEFSGTPYRTLPVRKKPLVQLDDEYYAVDPCFTRDAGYRALLFNLLQRNIDYSEEFKERQKVMSESAFHEILVKQLPNAKIYQEVYYKDPKSNQWSENDTLIIVDDTLYLVEAKAGAAATISSPELDFKRHAQSVQDLIVKAYKQCKRFFEYLTSKDEVVLYNRTDGKYQECGRIKHSDFRVMIPIGLTVESFSPFSSICKELPIITPILGKHPFISISIDDLFVIKRFLPTAGVFSHYMEVRQSIAGIKGALLYDELDHLGAYISKNRFDQEIAEQLKDSGADIAVLDGMSKVVDDVFNSESWEMDPIPTQEFPDELLKLLEALDSTQAPGWLSAESLIRNFGHQGRIDIANQLANLRNTINEHPSRHFAFDGDGEPLFIWMQNTNIDIDWEKIKDKASAVSVFAEIPAIEGILVQVSPRGIYKSATHFKSQAPSDQTEVNRHIFDDAENMKHKTTLNPKTPRANINNPKATTKKRKKVGRNEPCPCGSGKKYKRCHGY